MPFTEILAKVRDRTFFNEVIYNVKEEFEYGTLPEDGEKDLDRLIHALAVNSTFTFTKQIPEIIALGQRANGIHPLITLEFFVSTEDRREQFKRIYDPYRFQTTLLNPYGWVFEYLKNLSLEGFCYFLNKRSEKGDLLTHLDSFCERTRITKEAILPFLLEGNYQGFIETIIPK